MDEFNNKLFFDQKENKTEESLLRLFSQYKMSIENRITQSIPNSGLVGDPKIGDYSINLSTGIFARKFGRWEAPSAAALRSVNLDTMPEINITNICQGPIGSCYLLAAAGSILSLEKGRTYINTIMGNLGENHIWARFWKKENECYKPIIILMKNTLPKFMGNLHASCETTSWFAYLEKAYSILRMSECGKSSYSGLSSGLGGVALKNLYGKDARFFTADKINDIRYILCEDQANRQVPMTVSFKDKFIHISKSTRLQVPYEKDHAYAILNYNPDNDKVQLYNPWGNEAEKNSEWVSLKCIKDKAKNIMVGEQLTPDIFDSQIKDRSNQKLELVYIGLGNEIVKTYIQADHAALNEYGFYPDLEQLPNIFAN